MKKCVYLFALGLLSIFSTMKMVNADTKIIVYNATVGHGDNVSTQYVLANKSYVYGMNNVLKLSGSAAVHSKLYGTLDSNADGHYPTEDNDNDGKPDYEKILIGTEIKQTEARKAIWRTYGNNNLPSGTVGHARCASAYTTGSYCILENMAYYLELSNENVLFNYTITNGNFFEFP